MDKSAKTSSEPKLRLTRQRRVILEEIERLRTHPTAEQVYELVRRRLPHISLSTVYRNLDILSRRGMIQKLELGAGPSRFDPSKEPHYHVCCICCGCVEDLHTRKVFEVEEVFGQASDYEIVGHRMALLGLCPKCKRQTGGRSKPTGEEPER